MVNLYEYCKHPFRFQQLPVETRTYYDHICRLKESFNSKTQISKVGQGLTNLPNVLVSSILSPEGLEMLSIFMGVNLTTKVSLNLILRGIAKGVGPRVMEAASVAAVERGALYVNSCVLTTALTSAVEEGSAAAVGLAILDAVSVSLSEIEVVVMIVQTLGTLIDAWDPEGYSEELTSESMSAINDAFNSDFITRFLSTTTIAKDKYGKPIHLSGWPVEYHLDAMLAAGDSTPPQDQKLKLFGYIVEYLDSLEYNSDGQRIARDPNDVAPLIDESDFLDFANRIEITLSGQNTVVAKWIRTHWIIVLLGVGLLTFLLLR